jgi:hypothetical protein
MYRILLIIFLSMAIPAIATAQNRTFVEDVRRGAVDK